MGGKTRSARTFGVVHLPLGACVMAEDVQNIRSFGSESELQSVVELVNDKLQDMRTNFEATHEWERVGAIQGKLFDADGNPTPTTIYDYFAEFGQTEQTVAIDWAQANSVKRAAADARRKIEDALGGDSYTGIRAFVSPDVMDALMCKDEIKNSYQYTQAQFLRDNQARGEFEWSGVTWEEYRGNVPTHAADGGTATSAPFIPANTIRFVPEGTQDIFLEHYGPPTFIEGVNTKGKPTYAKQERIKFDLGIEIFGQSNPLIICCRPSVLIKCNPTGTAPTIFMAGVTDFGPDGPSEKDISDLEERAKETRRLADHTKHKFDEDAADAAKRDVSVAKLAHEDAEKRKKAAEHAKQEEAKAAEKAEKEIKK